jgi:CDP-glucose 4,6-dehydratase
MKFYKGKTVLITGHTGFKGSWLCIMLQMAGAKVVGYSLAPPEEDNLFTLSHAAEGMESIEGDIRDLEHLRAVFKKYHPEIVIHMAAQPLV